MGLLGIDPLSSAPSTKYQTDFLLPSRLPSSSLVHPHCSYPLCIHSTYILSMYVHDAALFCRPSPASFSRPGKNPSLFRYPGHADFSPRSIWPATATVASAPAEAPASLRRTQTYRHLHLLSLHGVNPAVLHPHGMPRLDIVFAGNGHNPWNQPAVL